MNRETFKTKGLSSSHMTRPESLPEPDERNTSRTSQGGLTSESPTRNDAQKIWDTLTIEERRRMMDRCCELENKDPIAGSCVTPKDTTARQLHTDDWWTFDMARHSFYWDKCCDCGLVHKVHVRRDGDKLHIRAERCEHDPTIKQIDNDGINVRRTP